MTLSLRPFLNHTPCPLLSKHRLNIKRFRIATTSRWWKENYTAFWLWLFLYQKLQSAHAHKQTDGQTRSDNANTILVRSYYPSHSADIQIVFVIRVLYCVLYTCVCEMLWVSCFLRSWLWWILTLNNQIDRQTAKTVYMPLIVPVTYKCV